MNTDAYRDRRQVQQPLAGADGVLMPIPRVIVKFVDDIGLPYVDDVDQFFKPPLDGLWQGLKAQFPGIRINRLFTSLPPPEIQDLVKEAAASDDTYAPPNFLTFFVVECPPDADPELVAQEIATWPSVESAESEGLLGPPPTVHPSNNPRWPRQGYLNPAPEGIDAQCAWTKVNPGGAGERSGFVDMERGWTLNHDDLRTAAIPLISGLNQDEFEHGTGVLGIVAAVDNTIGDIGIATHTGARVISEWRSANNFNRADAILAAVGTMSRGDVLLLETQFWPGNGAPPLPIEVLSADFQTIRLGVARGIVIIEPAGNGMRNLDNYTNAAGRHVLNRNSGDFQDSGAIMVGASTSTVPHARQVLSSYGSRIDCYAWGENVDTLSTDATGTATNQYTAYFNGTSGASAIVAGAALAVRGVSAVRPGGPTTPSQMRAMFSDPANGTASSSPQDQIGAMPDLRKILKNVFHVT